MKVLVIVFSLCFASFAAIAQSQSPVNWQFEVEQNEDGSLSLISKAKMKGNWSIYSQHTEEGGPFPLQFWYDSTVELIGETLEESEAITSFSDLFEVEVIKFKKEAVFKQKFNPLPGTTSIKGTLRYMCCDDTRCMPPTDVAFDVEL